MSLAGAPEDGAEPHGKLAELEGLGQEVIGPQIEAAKEVLGVAAAGEHEDGSLFLFFADLAEHLEAIEARQAEGEDDEVRPGGLPAAGRLRAVPRPQGGVASPGGG